MPEMPEIFYPVTGIQAGLDPKNPNEPKPLRQEVDAWILDPSNSKQINLFLRAMAVFQSMKVDDTLSYWQVAGIHGQPLVPWDENTSRQSKEKLGYCTHNSLLFPTWHRSYIALFEQRVYDIMLDLVKEYPPATQSDWLTAAQEWRLPYWDWAAKKARRILEPTVSIYDVPLIVKPRDVRVEVPEGDTTVFKRIPNPMYCFQTADGARMGDYGENGLTPVEDKVDKKPVTFYYDLCTATSRHPPKYDPGDEESVRQWEEGVQNNNKAAKAFYDHDWYEKDKGKVIYTDTLGEAVYHMFAPSAFPSYAAFATTRYREEKDLPYGQYLSLEDIHNNIHNWTGGSNGGFMFEVPVAGFDPIFWLHHCNVDRQLAIWQTLDQNEHWFSDPSEQLKDADGNWSTKPGTLCTPTTPLAPFRDAQGEYHTSDGVRKWATLGYSYPELQRWNFAEGEAGETAYLADINRRITKLYSSTRGIVLDDSKASYFTTEMEGDHHVTTHDDWIVNIRFERYALGGSPFAIHIFLGDKYHAGSVFNFSTPPGDTGTSAAGCENCQQQIAEGAEQKAQVSITNALLRAVKDGIPGLPTYETETVTEYLKANLKWRILASNYREIPVESLPSLKVYAARGTGYQYHKNKKLSRYEGYEPVWDITRGQVGGAIPEE